MNRKHSLRTVITVAILLAGALPAANFAAQLAGSGTPSIINIVRGQDPTLPQLGIDCGLGTTLGVFTAGGTPPVTGDGVLDPTCTWSGDADALSAPDATTEPLVSDNPESLPGTGGGFSAEIRVANLNGLAINGWDISVRYDTTILNGVKFDQTGLIWTSAGVATITPAASIDNNFEPGIGVARFAQVVLSPGPQFPDASGGLTLFRIRFDVVGVGTGQLTIFNDVLTNPGVSNCASGCPHKSQSGALNSESFFDPTGGLGWSVSWTFTPNPEVPGSPLQLSATATCTGCVAALSYSWDTDSDGVADATGNPATITAPPPIVHRVVLTVTDGTNTASAVKRLPLTLKLVAPASVVVGGIANFNGLWLGGNPNYSGNWRLCPGSTTQQNVCSNPAPTVAATASQNSPQTVIYNFAGVYNNTLKISDTAVPQISTTGTTLSTFVLYTVTGIPGVRPQAYVVTAKADTAKATVGQTVTFTATNSYSSNYPAYARSADTVVNGTAPAVGAALRTNIDKRIVFVDTTTGAGGTIANGLWDPSEWIFFCGTLTFGSTCTSAAIPSATVLYAAAGARPTGTGTGETVKVEPHLGYVGASTGFVPGNPVIYDVNTNSFFDAFFDVHFQFGDGFNTHVTSASGASGGPLTNTWTYTTTHSYSTAGTFPVTVNALETGTAAISRIQETASMSMVVNPVAQPLTTDFTVSASPTSGKPITFTGTASGGTAPYSLSFNFGDFTPSGTCSIAVSAGNCTVTHSYAVKGSFTAALTTTDSATPTPHTATASHPVSVAAQPLTVDFSFTPTNPTAGKPVSFTASGTGGTGPYSFAWTFNDGGSASGSSVSHTFTVKGSYTATVTVTDMNGATASMTHPVVVSAQPLSADFSFSPATVVVGNPVNFTGSATGGTPPYSFAWNFGDGSSASGVSVLHSYSVKGSYTVTLIVTDMNGVFARASRAVAVSPQPLAADFTFTPANPTAGKPVSFTATVFGGTSPYAFNWAFGDGQSGTGQNPTHSFSVKGSYTVSLTVTDMNSASVSATHTIVVSPQTIVVDFVVSPTAPTVGRSATFTATVSGGTSPFVFAWSFGDGSTGSGNPVGHTYNATGPVTVSLNVTDMNGATAASSHSIIVVAAGLTNVDFAPAKTLVGTTNFVALITGGAPPFSCTWNFGDASPSQTGCTPAHTYAAAGNFTVTLNVQDNNGSTGSKTKIVIVENAPSLIRGKVHWTHHLHLPGPQVFTAKVRNPSDLSVPVTLTIDIFDGGGAFVARVSGTTVLAPNSIKLDFTVSWTPPNIVQGYSFTARLSYAFSFGDLNGDGTPEMVTGTDGSKSGTFAVVM